MRMIGHLYFQIERRDNLKRIFFSLILFLLMLTACNNKETETNYYLSLSGESEHWKLDGYEIMITPEDYKAGNGILTMKNTDEHMANFLSFDTYAVVGGEEHRLHGHSVSGEADIAKQNTGKVDGEEQALKEPTKIDEIYAVIRWNDQDTDVDKEERIDLYNKSIDDDSSLN